MMRSAISSALITVALAGSGFAQNRFSQEELLGLPRVCLAQKFINSALRTPVVPESERIQWAQRLGATFESFHHFCWGLIDMRRASGADPSAQKGHYTKAVANFGYVERNADSSFPMLPEVLLRKGMALRLLGRDAEAATGFTDAIRVKPDYTPAYAALVDLYVDLDDPDGARDILEQGLREAPQSNILRSKKVELEALK
jgi:tetratricopeptide (TPR) repeat protein